MTSRPITPLQRALLVNLMEQVPPPIQPPRAAEAPFLLTRFIYYMTRDWIPTGVIETALAHARAETYPLTGHHAAWADDIARQLAWEPEGADPAAIG